MTGLPLGVSIHVATSIDDLSARTLHDIAQLRQRVFVVDQDCAYLDLDGRDLEPGTVQLWAATEDGEIAATLRLLDDSAEAPGQRCIGRVVTAPAWRGHGIAAALINAAIELSGDAPVVLHAQSYLSDWYQGLGFTQTGPEYLDIGIPHIPMLLTRAADEQQRSEAIPQ